MDSESSPYRGNFVPGSNVGGEGGREGFLIDGLIAAAARGVTGQWQDGEDQ
jgi:hypothetical protein